jgi:AraC-like DNA-binding protein
MASRALTAPDRIYAIATLAAPPGSRWCDHDLDTGQLLFYGPEVRHTAVNPVGVHFAFAAMDQTALRQTADGMGLTPNLPGPGEIRAIPTAGAHALRHILTSLANPAPGLVPDQGPELLRTTIETLRTDGEVAFCRRIDSGALVLACLDYAERAQRVPSIDELCAATFVCRRKLWDAFDERYGIPPGRFFRTWGLAEARKRLQTTDPTTTTVVAVANDLGFHHAGRFASRYSDLYGEPPSQTLRSSC